MSQFKASQAQDSRRQRLTLVLAGLALAVFILSVYMFGHSNAQLRQAIQAERMDYVEEISRQTIACQKFMEESYCELALSHAATLSRAQIDSLSQALELLPRREADDVLLLNSRGELTDLLGRAVHLPTRELLQGLPQTGEVVRLFSSLNYSDDYWLFAAKLEPFTCQGEEYLFLVLAVPADEFRENLSISLFQGRGASYIIKNDGSIRIKPYDANQVFGGYNLLMSMEKQGASPQDTARLQTDMWENTAGSFLFHINGEDWLLSHNAIDSENSLVVAIPLTLTAAQTYAGLSSTIIFAVASVSSLALVIMVLLSHFSYRDRLRSRQAMAVAAKSDFFSKMSHDIRTPLNAVMGLELLARDSSTEPQVREYLSQSSASAAYLLSIINDVLDMSRIESGKMTIASLPFDMNHLLGEVRSVISPMAMEKSLDFTVGAEPAFATVYLGDQLRLKQILINLLSNAVKFTPNGGKIKLQVSHQEQDQSKDLLTMTVSDTGIGVSPENMQRIFDPFEQERSSYTQQHTGSGLGLSIVRNLTELMGGTVDLESREGKGATFTVTLALERGERLHLTGRAREELPSYSFAGRRVLLAEDNTINQKVAAAILSRKFSLTVDIAPDGRQAVERFANSSPGYYDLILMDVKMPALDGLAATRLIRGLKRPDAGTVPILALSANVFEEDVALSLAAGMNDHLAKPIDTLALSRALQQFLPQEGGEEKKIQEDLP